MLLSDKSVVFLSATEKGMSAGESLPSLKKKNKNHSLQVLNTSRSNNNQKNSFLYKMCYRQVASLYEKTVKIAAVVENG